MDIDRFDALARSLTIPGTRRGALAALLAGALGLRDHIDADAWGRKWRGRRRRRRKKQRRLARRSTPSSTPAPFPGPASFCDGKIDCNTSTNCNSSGPNCTCLQVIGETAQTFCAGETRVVLGCGDCVSGETCVFPFNCLRYAGCAQPCANPIS